jgi:predicted sulfurtransferase
MTEVINISGYKFVTLEDLSSLRGILLKKCFALNVKGTILVSPEGINVVMSGARESVDALMDFLKADSRFSDMLFKESISSHQPFNRTLVRIKKEIIAFGVEGVEPAKHTSPHLSPKILKKWLDEGRDVVLLDTRNEYEVKLGTFKNAINPHVDTFREFPEAVRALPDSLKEKTVVTFCTGGVRCEKAAPFLEKEGFKDVYQIDGGILKYFEECGGAHWEGDCFVFDHRVALNPQLEQSTAALCFRCREPLTPEEIQSEAYVVNVSCPYCINKKVSSRSEG